MPQIMTMSNQQTLSPAPLDLRTTTRGRESGADRTAANTGRPGNSAEVKAESPTHRGDCMNGARIPSIELEHHRELSHGKTERTDNTNVSDSLPQVRIKPEAASEDTLAARSQDASTSRLPFRKRPYPAGSDYQTQSGTVSSKDFTNGAKSPKRAVSPPTKTNGHDDRTRRDVLDNYAQDTTRQLDHHMFNPYALCHWSVLPHALPGATVPHSIRPAQVERLQADVLLATQQDEDGDTPLHIAVVQGLEEMVHRLIHILKWAKKDVDIYNNMRQTPLHLSIITGHVALVEALLSANADPAALDRNGQNALHLCCEYNHAACLSSILQLSSGSTQSFLETRNYEGLSPLHLAVQSGNKELVKLLLKYGADINGVDNKSGRSPLMHAVEANNMAMVSLLIEYRCDVNAQSYSGNTALHSACGRGHIEAVRTLLKNGGDSSLKNYHNDTAIMVAKNKRVIDVLRGKGTRSSPLKATDIQTSPQHTASHAWQLNIHGPSSPQYMDCSPVSSQHALPMNPLTHAPLDPSAAGSLSNRRSPMDVKDRAQMQRSPGGRHHTTVVRREQFLPRIPQPCFSIYPGGYAQQLGVLMPPHPPYSTGLAGSLYHHHHHQEGPVLVLPPGSFPPQIPFFSHSQTVLEQSRSSSRSSDHSDVSTMSVNSDSKGESYPD